MSEFPSFLPLESSVKFESRILSSDLAHVLHADRASETALEMGTLVNGTSDATIRLLEHSVEWLEAASQRHRRRLYQLSARRNERANLDIPIAHLPTEIIHDIFRYDADEHPANLACSAGGVNNTWLRLSQVCRVWRRIVFSMPTMWGNDLFGFREGRGVLDVLLPLTKDVPLNIDLMCEDGPSIIHIQNCLQLIPRAWKINYGTFNTDQALALMNMLSADALPHLENLIFSASTRGNVARRLLVLGMAQHPNLRFLTLGNVYMRPPTLGKLSALDINLYDWPEEQRLSIQAIIDVLSENTSLRQLSLHHVLSSATFIQHSSSRRLSLPRLNHLSLYHNYSMLSSALLDCVHIGAIHEVEVDDWDATANLDNTLRAFEAFICAWTQPTEQQSQLAGSDPPTVETASMALFLLPADDVLQGKELLVSEWLQALSRRLGVVILIERRAIESSGAMSRDESCVSYLFKRHSATDGSVPT